MFNIFLVIAGFFFTEFLAWFSHKYIMHGFLWSWHKDHHINDHGKVDPSHDEKHGFEKNDLFFLVYAIPAALLIFFGLYLQIYSMVFFGAGITLYGFTYFIIHDVAIHKRAYLPFLWKNNKGYFKALIKAHRAHHWGKNVRDFQNYGLLIFPKRYFKEKE